MRMSIADQSFASVPPAPELMVSTAPRLSPSSPSMLRSSRASSASTASAYAASISSSSSSSNTFRSSTDVITPSKPVTQNLTPESSFRNFSASLGSSQKSGASVRSCLRATSSRFASMSMHLPSVSTRCCNSFICSVLIILYPSEYPHKISHFPS